MKTRHLGPERDLVLDIFSSVEPGPFEDLYSAVFQPMERAVLDNTPDSQLSLLRFYTTLLRNWTISLSAADKPPAYAASSLTGLIDHTWRLALTVAQSSPSASTDAYILDFYAQTHVLHSNPAISQYSRVVVPPAQLVYIIFFKQSLANISRLCATLAEYKRVFEGSLSRKQYERDLLNQFNGFLMDICNCIWRARAFNSTDPNASGCLMAQPVVERLTRYVAGLDPGFSLSSVFSLSFSPPLCLQSISALRELEDAAVLEDAEDQEAGITNRHAGPVTPDSLARLGANGGLQLSWQDYRLAVLTYLEAEGAVGIPELMYNTMKILMSARNSSNS